MDDARRQRLLQLSAAGVFLVIIIVVVVIVVAGSGGGGDDKSSGELFKGGKTSKESEPSKGDESSKASKGSEPSKGDESSKGAAPPKSEPVSLDGKPEVEKLLAGIPQDGMVLGRSSAPVKLSEWADLQCPFCKENAETVTAEVIENQVRGGEASLNFNQFIIIGPDSIPAGEAALAAGAQDKAWNFVELWYRNQGEENSGYVTEKFIEAVGKEAGIPDLDKWNKERNSGKLIKQLEAQTKQAEKLEFTGTPAFAIEGPSSKGLEAIGTPESSGQLEAAIEEAG